jgi:hypothetical protein
MSLMCVESRQGQRGKYPSEAKASMTMTELGRYHHQLLSIDT